MLGTGMGSMLLAACKSSLMASELPSANTMLTVNGNNIIEQLIALVCLHYPEHCLKSEFVSCANLQQTTKRCELGANAYTSVNFTYLASFIVVLECVLIQTIRLCHLPCLPQPHPFFEPLHAEPIPIFKPKINSWQCYGCGTCMLFEVGSMPAACSASHKTSCQSYPPSIMQ